MDQVKLVISSDVFNSLIENKLLKMSDVDIQQIEPKDFDYSGYPQWVEAKKLSTKAYKALKKIEFDIRNQ